jgi:hypothetical protein
MSNQRKDATNMSQESKKSQEKLVQEIVDLKAKISADEIRPPQIFLTDVTPEAAQNALAEQGGRISLLTDEGNLFDILSGMYSNGKQNLDVFLQGHAGGPLRVKRNSRIVDLPDIAISIGLAIQPAVLSEQSEMDSRKFRGKGLLARFLFNLSKSNIGKRDVRKRKAIPNDVRVAYAEGIKALLSIQPHHDEHGVEVARMVTLDRDALACWERFAQYVEDNQGDGGKFERLQDFTGKLPGAALRIAGICEAAEHLGTNVNGRSDVSLSASSSLSPQANLEIKQQTIEPILDLCESLIIHTQAAFDLLGDDPAIGDAKYALKWLRVNAVQNEQGAYMFRQNALHSVPRFKNSKLARVTKALDILHERHIISTQQTLATKKPTYVYHVNPAIFQETA